jgi:hypothetical protein
MNSSGRVARNCSAQNGCSKGRIVREELEKARNTAKRPFLRWQGAIAGPSDLSMRKGFSRK